MPRGRAAADLTSRTSQSVLQALSPGDAPLRGCCTAQPPALSLLGGDLPHAAGGSTYWEVHQWPSKAFPPTPERCRPLCPSSRHPGRLFLPGYRQESGLSWASTISASEPFGRGGGKACVPFPGLLQLCLARRKGVPARGEPTSPPSRPAPPSRGGFPSHRQVCAARRDGRPGWGTSTALSWQPGKFSGHLENLELNFTLSGAFPSLGARGRQKITEIIPLISCKWVMVP